MLGDAARQAGSPPRAWGILDPGAAAPASAYGSPPRAWGIRQSLDLTTPCHRFTPTCVGNTSIDIRRIGHGMRFTPTCVGKTLPPRQLARLSVHPHVRGEYSRLRRQVHAIVGSPPRAWGIRHGGLAAPDAVRFTPTCVGNTVGMPIGRLVEFGSPPRAWGIRSNSADAGWSSRFTPTCVGNTRLVRWCGAGYPVHPHMRGEY